MRTSSQISSGPGPKQAAEIPFSSLQSDADVVISAVIRSGYLPLLVVGPDGAPSYAQRRIAGAPYSLPEDLRASRLVEIWMESDERRPCLFEAMRRRGLIDEATLAA